MAARYAVYFAPAPDSELWRFGSSFTGRDAATDRSLEQPRLPGITPAALAEVTASPRHYGFHATLKPPFELAGNITPIELRDHLARFAQARRPFKLDLTVGEISSFLALTPKNHPAELLELARDCVRDFEPYRKAETPEESARRVRPSMTPRQLANLQKWGYPYVFEDFRFHMTITGRIQNPTLRSRIKQAAKTLAKPLTSTPVPINGLALFHQPDRTTPFTLVERFLFKRTGGKSF